MPPDELLSAQIREQNPGHTWINVWEHGGYAGTLAVGTEHAQAVLDRVQGKDGQRLQFLIGDWFYSRQARYIEHSEEEGYRVMSWRPTRASGEVPCHSDLSGWHETPEAALDAAIMRQRGAALDAPAEDTDT